MVTGAGITVARNYPEDSALTPTGAHSQRWWASAGGQSPRGEVKDEGPLAATACQGERILREVG